MTHVAHSSRPIQSLLAAYHEGRISRRSFALGAAALGLSASMVSFFANSARTNAQEATPAAEVGKRPDAGTAEQTRGAGGELRIIQWQAPTTLSPHNGGGIKDWQAALLVFEPLIHYGPQAEMIPNLLTEIPSLENGGLADDLTSVTLHLLPDVTWSDGEPLTAADVAFTIDWVQNPKNAATTISAYEMVTGSKIIDDLTIEIQFSGPNPFWADPFSGTQTGWVYPKHILEDDGATSTFMSNPIGTGPFIVKSFSPNDTVEYELNKHYREPNKPFFDSVLLKGGGDATSAARAVLQTGEFDFAWNLQIEQDVLNDIVERGDQGEIMIPPGGTTPEILNINFSDPYTEVDGQRSEMNTPHPILSDISVRKAIALGIDRQKIADEFYGFDQEPTPNILNGAPEIESPNTDWNYDPNAAATALDEGGWKLDGNIRKKDDTELSLTHATSVNAVRQKTQALIKSNLEEIGFSIKMESIDAGIFFDSSAGNDQSQAHFYSDLNEQMSDLGSPRPIYFMSAWYAGPNGDNIAQKSNGWTGHNFSRYQNADYDAAYEQALIETDPETLIDLFIKMNDILMNDYVIIPLVLRTTPVARSLRLRPENIALAPFTHSYWNIANWNLEDGAE